MNLEFQIFIEYTCKSYDNHLSNDINNNITPDVFVKHYRPKE